MQIYRHEANEEDRRIARRWRISSLGFYGSILLAMILYAVLNPKPAALLASGDARPALSTANAPHKTATEPRRQH